MFFFSVPPTRKRKSKPAELDRTQVKKKIDDLIAVVRERNSAQEDECDKFLGYLGTKMRKVPEERRTELERRILEIVQDEMST